MKVETSIGNPNGAISRINGLTSNTRSSDLWLKSRVSISLAKPSQFFSQIWDRASFQHSTAARLNSLMSLRGRSPFWEMNISRSHNTDTPGLDRRTLLSPLSSSAHLSLSAHPGYYRWFRLLSWFLPFFANTMWAIPLALGSQHRRFSRSPGLFLLFQQVTQPDLAQFPVNFNEEDENSEQDQQVVEQGQGWAPFCECAGRPILPFSAIIALYTTECGGTRISPKNQREFIDNGFDTCYSSHNIGHTIEPLSKTNEHISLQYDR